jgi:hypothetical protein
MKSFLEDLFYAACFAFAIGAPFYFYILFIMTP